MRERIGRARGPRARGDLGQHLPLRLRADPAPRGRERRLRARLLDLRRRRPAPLDQALPARGARRRPEAGRARAASRRAISDAKNARRAPEEVQAAAGLRSRGGGRRRLPRYSDALRANGAMDFDDLLMVTAAAAARATPDVRARWQGRFRPRAGGRVPGHQPRPVPPGARCSPSRSATWCVVGDDDQGIYSLARRRRAQHPRLRARLPRRRTWSSWSRTTAPPAPSSRAANAVIERNPQPQAQAPVDRPAARASRSPASRAATSTRRPGWCRADRRGAAPRAATSLADVAVFYRTNAQSRAIEEALRAPPDAVRGGRRPPLLRARRDPRPARLPARGRQPVRRREPGADAGRAASAASAPARSRSWRPTPRRSASPWLDVLLRPDEIPGLPAGQRADAGPDAARCCATSATTSAAGTPLDRVLEEVLERSGLRDALAGRGDVRGAGADREPGGDGAGGGRVRGHPAGGHARGLPGGDRPPGRRRPGRLERRRRHADDDPQRQGPGVRHRPHHRARGGPLPPRALRHAGDAGGGAAPVLRGPHAGAGGT